MTFNDPRIPMRKSFGLFTLLLTVLASCTREQPETTQSPSPTKPTAAKVQESNVEIEGFKFNPEVVTVAVGTTVSWVNFDPYFHTVTSGKTDGPVNEPDGTFDDDLKDKGDVVNVTFDTPGVFTYFCKQHNAMNAEIRVS